MTTIENKNLPASEELVQLNTLFAKRYTDEDEEYIQMAKPRSISPPTVHDWGQDRNNYRNQRHYYANERYNNNSNRNDYQQNRNHSYDNRYRRDRDRSPQYYHDKRR